MSIQFNDTSTLKGLVQLYEVECGFDPGFISGNTTRLKQFTAQVNLALDNFMLIAGQASGMWQFDDSNHTKDPIIYTTLTSGQRDYHFTTDEQGNLILDIYKAAVLPSATATLYQELDPIDELEGLTDIVRESTVTGVPTAYGKLANGIFLDIPPSYTVASGLKMYINREAFYFASDDTTDKPGVPGILHEYFYLKPALNYARQHGTQNLPRLEAAVLDYEGSERLRITGKIAEHFAQREKDYQPVMSGEPIDYE